MRHTKKNKSVKSGFTLVEALIVVGITALLFNVVSTFGRDVFSLNSVLSNNLNAQLDARHLIKVMVVELRKASPSSIGAYPIVSANPSEIVFYSDIDNDGLKDRIRYYLDGDKIKKGVIVPNGNPLTYNDTNETTKTIMSGVIASSTLPLFRYYPATYSGTSASLSMPVTVSVVRLVDITVIIDTDPRRSPEPFIVTSSVNLRNLKDNL